VRSLSRFGFPRRFIFTNMKEIALSNRLLQCAEFIYKGNRVADIGADHGYLSIYLILNNISDSVIASDLREKPIQNAMKNAEKYEVSDKIRFLCRNGLDGVSKDWVESVICAGMGADCIIDIMTRATWTKNSKYQFVLQPQSSPQELRSFLYKEGFAIQRERLAKDGDFLYNIIDCCYCGFPYEPTPGELYVSKALMQSGDTLLPQYLERISRNLTTSITNMNQSAAADQKKLAFFCQAREEIMEMEKTLCLK